MSDAVLENLASKEKGGYLAISNLSYHEQFDSNEKIRDPEGMLRSD